MADSVLYCSYADMMAEVHAHQVQHYAHQHAAAQHQQYAQQLQYAPQQGLPDPGQVQLQYHPAMEPDQQHMQHQQMQQHPEQNAAVA